MDEKPLAPQAPEPAPAAEAEAASAQGKKREFVSKGEHIHHWGTYLSIDWLFNTAAGVTFAYLTKHTDKGEKYWSGPITRGFEKGMTKLVELVGKDPVPLAKSISKGADYGNMFMSIIAGGMLTIPPLLVLENKKVKKAITQRLDHHIYGKDKCENDPKFQKAYDEIDNAPKKDFSSGMWARFCALAPMLAMVIYEPTKELSNKVWFQWIEKGSDKVARAVGFSPEKNFGHLSPEKAAARWKFIHESVAMDFGLGLPYAGLHSVFYNIFAARKANKKARQHEEPIAPISESLSAPVLEAEQQREIAAVSPAPRSASFTAREMHPVSFTDRAAADTATQEHAAAR